MICTAAFGVHVSKEGMNRAHRLHVEFEQTIAQGLSKRLTVITTVLQLRHTSKHSCKISLITLFHVIKKLADRV